jgi:K(+)-stimulated pyrophosphate-energized sodium pump
MVSLPGATPFEVVAIWGVLVIAFFGLAYAMFLRRQVMACDKGTEKMQDVWDGIRLGANAYLKRQLKTIVPLIFVFTVILFLSVYVVPPTEESKLRFAGYSDEALKLIIGFGRAVAFIMGSIFSLMVGQFGMRMAVQANVRVASASRRSFAEALKIAYRAGTVTGMLTDGLGLLGGTLIFIIFGVASPDTLLGFGFGGTLLALFRC